MTGLPTLAVMAFGGWPVEAIEFFEGLEADNSKAYFTANKTVYEEAVRAPMTALFAELAAEFGGARIYRPYRDVRFSKDKAPYKTSIAGSFEHNGYVALSTSGLGVGTGMYMMGTDQIARYREAVADEAVGAELEAVIAALSRAGIDTSSHSMLKTAPRGYPKDHPRIELLRYKDVVSWCQWPVGAWLGTPEPKERVVRFLRACRPLEEWLAEHVGPSTEV